MCWEIEFQSDERQQTRNSYAVKIQRYMCLFAGREATQIWTDNRLALLVKRKLHAGGAGIKGGGLGQSDEIVSPLAGCLAATKAATIEISIYCELNSIEEHWEQNSNRAQRPPQKFRHGLLLYDIWYSRGRSYKAIKTANFLWDMFLFRATTLTVSNLTVFYDYIY